MNIVFDFIISLFVPKKMDRFRRMYVLVSLVIFILMVYLLLLPINNYFNRNFDKLVNDDSSKGNLLQLQVLTELPSSDNEYIQFVNRIKSKNLNISNGTLTSSDLGIKKVSVNESGNLIGIINYDYDNNSWIFDDGEVYQSTKSLKNIPSVVSINDNLVISDLFDDAISYPGITQDDKVTVIKVNLNNRRKLLVDDQLFDYIKEDEITFGENNGYLVINDQTIDYKLLDKTIIYYVYNGSVDYYEDDYSYRSTDGFVKNIKLTIDLSSDYVTNYEYQYDSSKGYPGNPEEDEYYYISLFRKSIYYQSQLIGVNEANITHGNIILHAESITGDFDTKYSNLKNFTNEDFHYILYRNIQSAYVGTVNAQYTLVFIFDCVILPLLLSLIYFLMFRKNGRMKKWKEYYVVSSIAILLPALICFGIMWFYPPITSYVFILSFGVWYLFVCFKINTIRELK